MSEGLAEIAKMLPLDSSFTGRTDIWTFALQSLQLRLPTGYGFAAFWGSECDPQSAGRQGVGGVCLAQP